ncbi:OsmC family protein [Thermotoga sp. SG1]|uniref:OsmC family protein n=1 Tax=Thermotoga sp. SG1 TaxID=126739 RepID=UPI000C7675F0|nr:OsmC family protein [Thermotoga sp. SG1]PLV56745.1 osmotically inducible protein C [Thermotoga sp. SG1]
MPDIEFKVSAISESPTKTSVRVRNFTVIVDEPEKLGGTDEGPNPVEYVLAAFAGCLNVVAHMVAKEMGMNLKGLSIEVSGVLNPDKLFGKKTDERPGYKQINVILKPETDANEDTIKRWLESIEERCPVEDTLKSPVPVEIKVEKS